MNEFPLPVTPDPLAAKLAEIRDRNEHMRTRYGHVGGLLALAGAKSDVPGLIAAVEAVLELHPQTAYTAHIDPCTAHLSDILGQRDCPDCRRIERTGCERCRDGNGHPATLEDCRERQAISRAPCSERRLAMAALERTTVRRARVQRRCGDSGCPPIKPGELYLEHVVSPGHVDLGNRRWRRLAECSECATRYGRGHILTSKPASMPERGDE